ncbi:hypothetical protein, partial [Roseibium sp. TrichSKD4]|uniref:hypothetical protein n=1 Tax=Roseibium sp. TrichSKD4 TaxID=744980 RepID=UPI00058DB239
MEADQIVARGTKGKPSMIIRGIIQLLSAFKTTIRTRSLGLLLWAVFGSSAAVILFQLFLTVFPLERTEYFVGPFASEEAPSNALTVQLNPEGELRYLFVTDGDTSKNPYKSNARISANALPLGPAHVIHETIRSGNAAQGSFSHWHDSVLFSLPNELANGSNVTLEITYQLILRGILIDLAQVLLFVSAVLQGLRYWLYSRALLTKRADRAHFWFTKLTCVFIGFLMLTVFVYLVSIVIGWAQGWALPTTAAFSQMPWLRSLAEADPSLSHAVLLYASIGAVLGWVAVCDRKNEPDLGEREADLTRLFKWFGLPIIIAWFLFSVAGTWAGIPRPQDLSGNAIAGLVPFNDATVHFTQTFEQAMTGQWNTFGSRRPLAAALRGAGMFVSGYSNVVFILLQTVAIATATFFATYSVMLWRGPWAGLTFLGLTMISVRAYLPTNLTEPLGILFALMSIPYLVRALASGDFGAKATAFLFTNLALTIRMGNMFAIPAIALWMFLTSAGGWRGRLRTIAAILGVVVLSFSITSALSVAFGSKSGEVGSNFSYTFCGLTHNADWTACERIYADKLEGFEGGEAAVAGALYKFGFAKFLNDPLLLATRLTTNMVDM